MVSLALSLIASDDLARKPIQHLGYRVELVIAEGGLLAEANVNSPS